MNISLPSELNELIESNQWPTEDSKLSGAIISLKLLKMFPEEAGNLVLQPPPFHTVKEDIKSNPVLLEFPNYTTNVNEETTIIIGWFGHGSDTCIGIDCSTPENKVVKYVWKKGWREVTETLTEFIEKLNLKKAKYKQYPGIS